MNKNGKKAVLLAVLATTMALGTVGCTNRAREGTGTNDGVKTRMLTNNYRPFNYGTGNGRDMRLGYDRYRGTDPDLIRDSGDMKLGLNRDNGFTGYDKDGVNNWRDYKASDNTHANAALEDSQQLAKEITALGPVEWASVMLTNQNAYVAVKLKSGEDLDATGHLKTQIADKVHMSRPEVKNVYVSSNPDLIERFKHYGEQLRQGKPISGLMNEFNTMVQKMFPTNASYGTNPTNLGTRGMNGVKSAPSAP